VRLVRGLPRMRMAETCGASRRDHGPGLSRLRLIHHRERREPVYQAIGQFFAEFERSNRTLICRDLLGCDIRKKEGMQAARTATSSRHLSKMVQDAAEILESILQGGS